jgi:hypothetical protein
MTEDKDKKPWVGVDLEEDDGLIDITWAFGPQGHPCSMRITIYMSEEENMVPTMSILGPRILGHVEATHWLKPLRSMKGLRACLEYGKLIEKKFGHSWWWHFCSKQCADRRKGPCKEHCGIARDNAYKEGEEWYKENPFPDL